ncbi:MAG: hypothetical protein Q9223_007612 [Gallowayella weberi]
MKTFLSIAAFGLIAVAQAQQQCAASAAAIPSCALECIVSAGSSVGCKQGDYACQCSSSQSAAIASAALGCVLSACGPATGLSVQGAASAVCHCVATAAPASTTAASSSSSSSATTTADASPSSTATKTSAVATTSASLSSAPYPTAPTTASPVVSAPSSGGVGSGAAGNGTVPFISGAPFIAASVGGIVGALFLAMIAL